MTHNREAINDLRSSPEDYSSLAPYYWHGKADFSRLSRTFCIRAEDIGAGRWQNAICVRVISSAATLIYGKGAMFPTEPRENDIASRDSDHDEREFGFPYYGNDAASND